MSWRIFATTIITVGIVLGLFNTKASALLFVDSTYDGVIRDDRGTADIKDDLLWIRDLTYGGLMTYEQQLTMIDNISDFGGGWSMATKEQFYSTFYHYMPGEDVLLFNASSFYYDDALEEGRYYYYGRTNTPIPSEETLHLMGQIKVLTINNVAEPADLRNHRIEAIEDGELEFAWICKYQTVAEPGTLIFLAICFVGLIGYRRSIYNK